MHARVPPTRPSPRARRPSSLPAAALPPTSWTLWLAILITIICLPVCVVLLEFLSLKRRVDADDWVPGLREAALRSVWTLMLFESFQVTALGARILVLCFGFMSLLLVRHVMRVWG